MPEPDSLLSLGLNTPSPAAATPAAEDLQFERAEPVGTTALASCHACKQSISGQYFHAAGHMVCPKCASSIARSQIGAGGVSLVKAGLFGTGAMLAGAVIYTLILWFRVPVAGIFAVVLGIMVGKAIRFGTNGIGGRPQQIMAVILTYFAFSTSFMVLGIVKYAENHKPKPVQTATTPKAPPAVATAVGLVALVLFSAAGPILALKSAGGWLGLFLLILGMRSAWRLTARPNIPITGPYQTAAAG